jgi:hypothetical protein
MLIKAGDLNYTTAILAGRCANGNEGGGGSIVHWVRYDAPNVYATRAPALCGKTYSGRSAGFSAREEQDVTCPRCIKKMAKLTEEHINTEVKDEDKHDVWHDDSTRGADRFPG